MDLSSKKILQLIKINNKTVNLANNQRDLIHNWCSTYVESKKLLIQGQCSNKSKHNATISVFSFEKFQIKGKGLTSNTEHIWSVNQIFWKKKNLKFNKYRITYKSQHISF